MYKPLIPRGNRIILTLALHSLFRLYRHSVIVDAYNNCLEPSAFQNKEGDAVDAVGIGRLVRFLC